VGKNVVTSYTGGVNESIVVNIIRRQGPISRVDIAKLTGLTAPTVTNISGRLIASGIISECAEIGNEGKPISGRPRILLKINPEAANLIIVDIRSKEMTGYIVNAGLAIKEKVSVDLRKLEPEKVMAALEQIINKCISSELGQAVSAIGIIVRGPVLHKEGISLFSQSFGWQKVSLKFSLEQKFQLPVFVENDMRAIALGAYYYGKYYGYKNAVMLGVGWGIGAGIFVNGQLYRGISDIAGEIGHTIIDIHGPLCSCGKHGCLETFASEAALVNSVVSAPNVNISLAAKLADGDLSAILPEHIYEAAAKGDELSIKMLQNIARYLGVGVANIINFLNPELIIIGGGIVRGRRFIEEILLQVISEQTLDSTRSSVKVEYSAEGREAYMKGIADVVLEGIFLTSR